MRHEVHLAAHGLRAAGLASPVFVGGAALMGGRTGALSAAAGCALVMANRTVAAATTGWFRVLSRKVATIGYLGWIVRMAAVLAVLSLAASAGWVSRPALAISFCGTLAVGLAAECLGYMRGSYIPSWRLAR